MDTTLETPVSSPKLKPPQPLPENPHRSQTVVREADTLQVAAARDAHNLADIRDQLRQYNHEFSPDVDQDPSTEPLPNLDISINEPAQSHDSISLEDRVEGDEIVNDEEVLQEKSLIEILDQKEEERNKKYTEYRQHMSVVQRLQRSLTVSKLRLSFFRTDLDPDKIVEALEKNNIDHLQDPVQFYSSLRNTDTIYELLNLDAVLRIGFSNMDKVHTGIKRATYLGFRINPENIRPHTAQWELLHAFKAVDQQSFDRLLSDLDQYSFLGQSSMVVEQDLSSLRKSNKLFTLWQTMLKNGLTDQQRASLDVLQEAFVDINNITSSDTISDTEFGRRFFNLTAATYNQDFLQQATVFFQEIKNQHVDSVAFLNDKNFIQNFESLLDSGDITLVSNILQSASIGQEEKQHLVQLILEKLQVTQQDVSAVIKDALTVFLGHTSLPDEERNFWDTSIALWSKEQPEVYKYIITYKKRFISLQPEILASNIENIRKIFAQLNDSPSQEIRKYKSALVDQIFISENPAATYKKIEDIFLRSNLPLVGKVFSLFEYVHSPEKMATELTIHSSPTLQEAGSRRRMSIIYRDLLKVHMESGNPSLREYAQVLSEGDVLMSRFMDEKGEPLSEEEKTTLRYTLAKLNTLYAISLRGRTDIYDSQDILQASEEEMRKYITSLSNNLGVREGQTISTRVAEMFLRPLGLDSLGDIIEKMDEAKHAAHVRNVNFARSAINGRISLQAGDLLKGVDVRYYTDMCENGFVSKEFIGQDSDKTPFDTDVSMVLAEDVRGGFLASAKRIISKALYQSHATDYNSNRNLIIGIRDRGQFSSDKYELFPIMNVIHKNGGEQDRRHYGIRTGIASTEQDFLIAPEALLTDTRRMNELYCTIAQNGFYVPVADETGKIIFTPEMYEEYRHLFDGIQRYNGGNIEITRIPESNSLHARLEMVIDKIKESIPETQRTEALIRDTLVAVLEAHNVLVKTRFDRGILGADVRDTGSTSRGTNIPGSGAIDFDYSISVNPTDFQSAQAIADAVVEKFSPQKKDQYPQGSDDGYIQVRMYGVENGLPSTADIDVGIERNSREQLYSTDEAIAGKLDWIRMHIGEDAYFTVLGNIVLTKEILKEGNAYKKWNGILKTGDGGIGGIGVETWILQHNGNLLDAFQSFYNAAYARGRLVSLDEFKQRYRIISPGINLKGNMHDDFVELLTEEGYASMARVVAHYLPKENKNAKHRHVEYRNREYKNAA